MILSHPHRFVFIQIGKTGTTTLRSILEKYGETFPLSPEEFALYHRNIPAVFARKKLSTDVWDHYFKFSVVRNPWDWVISNLAYNRDKLPFTTRFHPRRKVTPEQILELKTFFRQEYHRGITWSDTITQKCRLSDRKGNLLVDYVARLEQIQEDFDEICEKTFLPRTRLPRLNKTRRKPYRYYYTDETRKIVEDIYHDDITAFHYSFD